MKKLYLLLCFLILLLSANTSCAQGAPQQFRYQGVAHNFLGNFIVNQSISIKTGIHSGTAIGPLVWEETQTVTTSDSGLYVIYIGTGISTGAGTAAGFNLIPWQTNSFYMSIAIDWGTGYVPIGSAQLLSVPYSFYSNEAFSLTGLGMNGLTDADTAGTSVGKILKWNGTNWVPSIDNHHDSVMLAYTILNNNWHLAGNADTTIHYLGTNGPTDLIFKTNATEQMRITSGGQWAAGTTSPIAKTHWVGTDGFQEWGDTLSGALNDSSAGTRFMWYPRNAALRMGQVTNTSVWGDSKIGKHSFAEGYNCQASGRFSVSMGYNNVANGLNSVCIGRNNYASIDTGTTSYGGEIAMGDGNFINITRSVAMGYHNRAEGGISIGYHNRTRTGSSSEAFGKDNTADGTVSLALGTNASTATKKGCFIFNDASGNVLYNSAVNQFMVRASGGVKFYSDTLLMNSVQLAPGGGSWVFVSDKRKKENFAAVDAQEILSKLMEIKITRWNYITQPRQIHHIGPMAQDMYAAFHIGENNYSVNTLDMDGIVLTGIKALEQTTRELSAKINQLDELKAELQTDANFDSLEKRLDKIEQTFKNK